MTERDFYRKLLEKQAVDKDKLLEEIKQTDGKVRKLRTVKWAQTAAAVICILVVGSAGLFVFHSYQNGLKSNGMADMASLCDTGKDEVSGLPEMAGTKAAGTPESAVKQFSWFAEEQMRSLARSSDCIVTAKAVRVKNGIATVKVVKSLRGSKTGETMQVSLKGAVKDREYLLFLQKDGTRYQDLLSDGGELYEADSSQDVYWPVSVPSAKQPLGDVREWAMAVSPQKKYENPIDNS